MRCLNHNIHHPNKKPRELQEENYICIKMTSLELECELDEVPQSLSYPIAWYKSVQENHLLMTLNSTETHHISGWGCILMTASHSRRCWNILHMYDVDLIWVWSVWGASIITFTIINYFSEKPAHLLLLLLLWLLDQVYVRLGMHPYDTNHIRRCWHTSYMYELDLLWVWSVWNASIIT